MKALAPGSYQGDFKQTLQEVSLTRRAKESRQYCYDYATTGLKRNVLQSPVRSPKNRVKGGLTDSSLDHELWCRDSGAAQGSSLLVRVIAAAQTQADAKGYARFISSTMYYCTCTTSWRIEKLGFRYSSLGKFCTALRRARNCPTLQSARRYCTVH